MPFIRSGGGNMVAIDLIVQHVHSQLEEVRKFTNTNLITYAFIHTLFTSKSILIHSGLDFFNNLLFVATTSSL